MNKQYRLNRKEARAAIVALAVFINLTYGITTEPIKNLREDAILLWQNLTFHYR